MVAPLSLFLGLLVEHMLPQNPGLAYGFAPVMIGYGRFPERRSGAKNEAR
jgi:hypothetical protein